MTQIAAASAVPTAQIAHTALAQPAAQPTPEKAPLEDTAQPATVRNSADPAARTVLDVRAGYEVGTKVERISEAFSSDFDRLSYVLEGFEHMRRVMAPAAEHVAPIVADVEVEPSLFKMDTTA